MEPQCWAGSSQSPGCKAIELQERNADLEKQLAEVRATLKSYSPGENYRIDDKEIHLIINKAGISNDLRACVKDLLYAHYEIGWAKQQIAALTLRSSELEKAMRDAHDFLSQVTKADPLIWYTLTQDHALRVIASIDKVLTVPQAPRED